MVASFSLRFVSLVISYLISNSSVLFVYALFVFLVSFGLVLFYSVYGKLIKSRREIRANGLGKLFERIFFLLQKVDKLFRIKLKKILI